MADRRDNAGWAGLRSVPPRTTNQVRSGHDLRHQGYLKHSAGEGDLFQRLERLNGERERLERRLQTWLSQKERTEAQIAAVELERKQILTRLEPLIRKEAEEAEQPRPVPIKRGRRAG